MYIIESGRAPGGASILRCDGHGREQRLVLGEVADECDDVRPGYLAGLVDAVIDSAGAMVDIGAGTGKATLAFARRVPSTTATRTEAADRADPGPPGRLTSDSGGPRPEPRGHAGVSRETVGPSW